MRFFAKIFFPIATLAVGCKLNPPETDTIYDIPDEFDLELAEIRDTATGKADLAMRITTTKTYNCTNVKIDAETDWQPNNVLIMLNKIVQPANCSPGMATATALLSLGNRPEAEYRCTLSLAGAVSINGTLNIGPETVTVQFEERAGVIVKRPVLTRIPQATVWGWAGFGKPSDQPFAKQFLAELADLTNDPAINPGFYGDFEWQSANDFNVFLEKPTGLQTLGFVRDMTAPLPDLLALLKKYRDDAGHPITILCWTSTGRI